MSPRLDELATLERQATSLGLDQLVSPELPDQLSEWLGRLALLYGVPFEHLVADARMLPVESIRWFYVDANWVESLVDGAFSVGAHSDRDIRYHRVMEPVIRRATDVAAGMLRSTLRGRAAGAGDGAVATERETRVRGGFLMRSAIVSGWPGLEVRAYQGVAEEDPATSLADRVRLAEATPEIELIRMDRLSPNVLLCLFPEVPGAVVINEPAESLHFGSADGEVLLREPATGEVRDDGATVGVPFRSGARPGVIDVARLAGDLSSAADVQDRDFGPADFAVQMVNAADKQLFTPTGQREVSDA